VTNFVQRGNGFGGKGKPSPKSKKYSGAGARQGRLAMGERENAVVQRTTEKNCFVLESPEGGFVLNLIRRTTVSKRERLSLRPAERAGEISLVEH